MTDDAHEAELDLLFQTPLGDLVGARDALVTRLRTAGDKAGAARVKALRRPTPAAWALNQLHFAEPGLLEQARIASEKVRALHAQDGVDPRALSAALVSQRAVLHEVVEAALKRCESAGLAAGPALQRKLLATLQGVLAGASEERFGRLTHDLEPGGFDAIAVVGSVASAGHAPRVPGTVPALVKAQKSAPEEETQLSEARALFRERELSVHDATKRVQQGKSDLSAAQREQASADARVREAEAALAALRERQRERASECERLAAQVAQASALEAQARAALESARGALADLEKRAR